MKSKSLWVGIIQFVAMAALFGPTPSADAATSAPVTLQLYNGPAPGSENWTYPEVVTKRPGGGETIANVVSPSITVYLPDPAKANGLAVILLPGGAMRYLAWDTEGASAAEWFNARGIAAIALKYRTLQTPPAPTIAPGGAPPAAGRGAVPPIPRTLVIRNANANPDPTNEPLNQVIRLAVEDAKTAIRLVRKNSTAWKIDPNRIGLIGFSAGGGVAIGAALGLNDDSYPNFLVSAYGPSLMDVNVPAYAPPLFIAVGADHQPVADGLIALHQTWKAAGKSSELHIFDGPRGGFAMGGTGNQPADHWTDRLYEWLDYKGLLKVRK